MVNDYLAGLAALGLAAVSGEAGASGLEEQLAQVQETCPEASIERVANISDISGSYGYLSETPYIHNPCTPEVENPLFAQIKSDWENGGTYGTSTPAELVAKGHMSLIPVDERSQQEYIDLARDMGVERLIPDSEFRGNPISFGY